MRRFIPILFLFILFPGPAARCQMVTTEPSVPLPGNQLRSFITLQKTRVTFITSFGRSLRTYRVSYNGTDWQNVIGAWGNNTTQPKLTYLGNYNYEMDLIPDIKTFYNLTVDEVSKICLVFRNPAGTLQTRPDIFIDVFRTELRALITIPIRIQS